MKTFKTVTGIGKPSAHAAEAHVRSHKPDAAMFADDGAIPNNPRLPFILYRGAVDLSNCSDPAAVFEELFKSNGWGSSWRNGIYGFVHYQSSAHEVLGIARGSAKVRLVAITARSTISPQGTSWFSRPGPAMRAYPRARTCWWSEPIRPARNTTNAAARPRNTSVPCNRSRGWRCRRWIPFTAPVGRCSKPGRTDLHTRLACRVR